MGRYINNSKCLNSQNSSLSLGLTSEISLAFFMSVLNFLKCCIIHRFTVSSTGDQLETNKRLKEDFVRTLLVLRKEGNMSAGCNRIFVYLLSHVFHLVSEGGMASMDVSVWVPSTFRWSSVKKSKDCKKTWYEGYESTRSGCIPAHSVQFCIRNPKMLEITVHDVQHSC